MGARLLTDRAGHGEPLLLLHGIGSTRDDFAALVPRLVTHFDVLDVDLPGCGGPASVPWPPIVAALTDAVEADLDARPGPRARARQFARRLPGGTVATGSSGGVIGRRGGWFRGTGRPHPIEGCDHPAEEARPTEAEHGERSADANRSSRRVPPARDARGGDALDGGRAAPP